MASINQKSFTPGTTVDLFVTCVFENTDSKWLKFWACDLATYDQVEILMTQIQEDLFNNNNIPHIGELRIEEKCCAKFQEDDRWYRAVITSKSKNEVLVFFIDYGNSEHISVENIRKVNPSLFCLPSLIREFVLADVECEIDKWSASALEHFANKITYEEIKAEIISVEKQVTAVKVITSDGVCLSDELIQQGFGIRKELWFGLDIKREVLQIAQKYSVYTAHVESPLKFWIHLTDKENELNNLMAEMDDFYNGHDSLPTLSSISIGALCACIYSGDDNFYRAMVTGLSTNSCEVIFIDYGNSESKKLIDLKLLSDNFKKLPAQAIKCSLSELDNCTPEVISTFSEATENKLLNALILKRSSDISYAVELFDQGVSVTSLLMNTGCASLQKRISPLSALRYVKSSLRFPSTEDVAISYIDNASNFSVQCVKDNARLEELMSQIEHSYKTSTIPTLEEPACVVGMACCANFSADDEWYRAEVISLAGNGQVEVKYVDYGNTEIVSISKVKPLLDEFVNIPSLAIDCCLPDLEGLPWDSIAYEKFETLTSQKNLSAKVLKLLGEKFGLELFDEQCLNINKELKQFILSSAESKRQAIIGNSPPASSVVIKVPVPVVNKIETIHVSFFESPSNFYGQLARFPVDSFENFQISLNKYYASIETTSNLFADGLSHIDEACCVKFSEDQLWYRGHVLKMANNNVVVRFIDFGNSEIKSKDTIKKLDSQFCAFIQQGIECYFIDAPLIDVSQLKDLLLENSIEIEAVEQKENKYGIVMTDNPINARIKKFFTMSKNMKLNTVNQPIYLTYAKPTCKTGQRLDISVTYVKSATQIWCQLLSQIDELDEVMDKIDHYCKEMPHSQKMYAVGDACIAKYSADDSWYRALVQNIEEGNKAEVYFIDYGNSEIVPTSDIREIKEEFLTLPFQCVECRLFGVQESAVSFDELNNLLLGKEFVMHIINIIGLIYEVELFDKQNNNLNKRYTNLQTTIAHITNNEDILLTTSKQKQKNYRGEDSDNSSCSSDSVFQHYSPNPATCQKDTDRGKILDSFPKKVPSNSELTSHSPEKLQYSTLDILLNSYEDVAVVHINDPTDFWCQLLCFSDKLQKLMESLNIFYDDLCDPNFVIKNYTIGLPCAAKYSEDEAWYRAQIISVLKDEVEVFFVDYGNSEIISVKKIKVLKPEFILLPIQAFHCTLFNIKSIDEKWTSENISAFKKLILDVPLIGHLMEKDTDGKYSIDLIDYRILQNVFVSSELIKSNQAALVAKSTTIQPLRSVCQQFRQKLDTTVSQSSPKERSTSHSCERSASAQFFVKTTDVHSKPRSFSVQPGKKSSPIPLDLSKINKYNVKEFSNGQKCQVVISWVINPSEFYCQLIEDQSALKQLTTDLDLFYNKLSEDEFIIPNLDIGLPCAAQFTENNSWNRALVKEINDGMIDVISVDFGFVEQLTSSQVKQALAEFMSLPSQAIKCCIRSIKPVGKEWPTLSQTRLKDLFGTEGTATFYASFNGIYVVDLQCDGKNVADELIAAGIAKAVSRSSSASPSTSGSCQQLATIVRSTPLTPLDTEMYLKVGGYEEIIVTYIESPQSFWSQLMKFVPLLEELMEHINVETEKLTEQQNLLSDISVASSCIAKTVEDDKWYRAIIKQLLTNDEVEVHFIDYGNCEILSRNKVKVLLPEFAILPMQAIECCLYNVSQTNSDMVECLRDSVENKEDCMMKIIEKNGNLVKVQLYDESETDINQLLLKKYQITINNAFNSDFGVPNMCKETNSVFESSNVTNHVYINENESSNKSLVNLLPGKQLLHICFVQSPKKFFVQKPESFEAACIMSDNLNEFYTTNSNKLLPLSDIKVDRLCFTQSIFDSNYYRATILSVENELAVLQFIDYGNCEKKAFKEIYDLPSDFSSEIPMAMSCQLESFKERKNLSEEFNQLFKKITEGKTFLADVIDTKQPISINIIEDENNQPFSLSFDSLNSPLSKNKKQNLHYPLIKFPTENPAFTLITDACSPLKFYVQILSAIDQLNRISERLEQKAALFDKTCEIIVGQPCAVLYSVDNCWYRALILNILEDSASVRFVDFGNNEIVEFTNIRSLSSEFLEHPPLALECCLNEIPHDLDNLPESLLSTFSQLVLGKEMYTLFLDSKREPPFLVELKDGVKNIAHCLLSYRPSLKLKSIDTADVFSMDHFDTYVHLKLKDHCREEVIVSYVESPSKFWVQLCTSQDQLTDLNNRLMEFYQKFSEEELTLKCYLINKPCVVLFSEDQSWYRAKIVNVVGDLITVHYVDYGNTETVKSNVLKEITKDFLEIPLLSLQCKLKDVIPFEKNWSEEINYSFEELTGCREKVLLAELSKIEYTYEVKLLDMGLSIADILIKNNWALYKKANETPEETAEITNGSMESSKDTNGSIYSSEKLSDNTSNIFKEKYMPCNKILSETLHIETKDNTSSESTIEEISTEELDSSISDNIWIQKDDTVCKITTIDESVDHLSNVSITIETRTQAEDINSSDNVWVQEEDAVYNVITNETATELIRSQDEDNSLANNVGMQNDDTICNNAIINTETIDVLSNFTAQENVLDSNTFSESKDILLFKNAVDKPIIQILDNSLSNNIHVQDETVCNKISSDINQIENEDDISVESTVNGTNNQGLISNLSNINVEDTAYNVLTEVTNIETIGAISYESIVGGTITPALDRDLANTTQKRIATEINIIETKDNLSSESTVMKSGTQALDNSSLSVHEQESACNRIVTEIIPIGAKDNLVNVSPVKANFETKANLSSQSSVEVSVSQALDNTLSNTSVSQNIIRMVNNETKDSLADKILFGTSITQTLENSSSNIGHREVNGFDKNNLEISNNKAKDNAPSNSAFNEAIKDTLDNSLSNINIKEDSLFCNRIVPVITNIESKDTLLSESTFHGTVTQVLNSSLASISINEDGNKIVPEINHIENQIDDSIPLALDSSLNIKYVQENDSACKNILPESTHIEAKDYVSFEDLINGTISQTSEFEILENNANDILEFSTQALDILINNTSVQETNNCLSTENTVDRISIQILDSGSSNINIQQGDIASSNILTADGNSTNAWDLSQKHSLVDKDNPPNNLSSISNSDPVIHLKSDILQNIVDEKLVSEQVLDNSLINNFCVEETDYISTESIVNRTEEQILDSELCNIKGDTASSNILSLDENSKEVLDLTERRHSPVDENKLQSNSDFISSNEPFIRSKTEILQNTADNKLEFSTQALDNILINSICIEETNDCVSNESKVDKINIQSLESELCNIDIKKGDTDSSKILSIDENSKEVMDLIQRRHSPVDENKLQSNSDFISSNEPFIRSKTEILQNTADNKLEFSSQALDNILINSICIEETNDCVSNESKVDKINIQSLVSELCNIDIKKGDTDSSKILSIDENSKEVMDLTQRRHSPVDENKLQSNSDFIINSNDTFINSETEILQQSSGDVSTKPLEIEYSKKCITKYLHLISYDDKIASSLNNTLGEIEEDTPVLSLQKNNYENDDLTVLEELDSVNEMEDKSVALFNLDENIFETEMKTHSNNFDEANKNEFNTAEVLNRTFPATNLSSDCSEALEFSKTKDNLFPGDSASFICKSTHHNNINRVMEPHENDKQKCLINNQNGGNGDFNVSGDIDSTFEKYEKDSLLGAGDSINIVHDSSTEVTNEELDSFNNLEARFFDDKSLLSNLKTISCQAGYEKLLVTDPESSSEEYYSFSLPDLHIGSQIEVLVLEANNPSNFFCQLASSSNNLPALMDALQDYYCQLSLTQGLLEVYKVGLSCVAQFDNGWYRAVISKVLTDSVEVLFVDYGSSEKLSCTKIKKLTPEFIQLPIQAFQCKLFNVSPPGLTWDTDSCTRFEEMTYKKQLIAETMHITQSEEILLFTVHVRLLEDNLDVATTLIEAGYAAPSVNEIEENNLFRVSSHEEQVIEIL